MPKKNKFTKELNKFQLSDEAYYGDRKYISNSMLGRLAKSPQHLKYYLEHPQKDTEALLLGRAFHVAVLESDRYHELFDISPIFDKRTKIGKEAYAEWIKSRENDSRWIITEKDHNRIMAMANQLHSIPDIVTLLGHCKTEQVNLWEDLDTGLLCKGKADAVGDDFIIDVKTTQVADMRAFKYSCRKYGYQRQAAYYSDGFNVKDFYFVVIEKTAPYKVGFYQCSTDFINEGREEYIYLLTQYQHHFKDNPNKIDIYYEEGIL